MLLEKYGSSVEALDKLFASMLWKYAAKGSGPTPSVEPEPMVDAGDLMPRADPVPGQEPAAS
eukprot:8894368-Lingulodinium_polyedra.AAC.1